MKISAITVSVGYSKMLARSIDRWRYNFDKLLVVTDNRDEETVRLCESRGAAIYRTDVFYENGAEFNKGAALSAAILSTGFRDGADWILCFDADIVPPENFREQIEALTLTPGQLYGAPRYWIKEDAPLPTVFDPNRRLGQCPPALVIGFFMLFHASDKRLPSIDSPLFDIDIPNAGHYDFCFSIRWPTNLQTLLPIPMVHLGEEKKNWCGVGNSRGMMELRTKLWAKPISNVDTWMPLRMKRPPKMP